jgi:hypothetical protein
MFLLVEYEEANNGGCGHITCIGNDSYSPEFLADTREEIVSWFTEEYRDYTIRWNGDTVYADFQKFGGKRTHVFHLIEVEKGERIVY